MHQKFELQYPNLSINWIIVDDGSNYDYSESINRLSEEGIKYQFSKHKVNRGKGQALRTACEISSAEVIIFTDIDFPYEFESFTAILDALLAKKADVVYGIRAKEYFNNIPSQRRLISSIVKRMNQILFKLPSPDTQCGLKGFLSTVRAEFLATRTNRYLIDLEFLHRVARNPSISILPMHVSLHKGTKLGTLKLSSLVSEIADYLKIFLFY